MNPRKFIVVTLLTAPWLRAAPPAHALVPVPAEVTWGAGRFRIAEDLRLGVQAEAGDAATPSAANRTLVALKRRTGIAFAQEFAGARDYDTAQVRIQVGRRAEALPGVDESYRLESTPARINITAPTSIGALRALATLVQLVERDNDGYFIPEVRVADAPRFPWRGLMLDVSRHFAPVPVVKRHIDAMAAVKLNVLHLHLSDDEGFRMESAVFPELHQKGSNGNYYTQAQMRGMVAYAAARGIVIVPEFDMPGHATSWFASHPELASTPGPYRPMRPFQTQIAGPISSRQSDELMERTPLPAFDPSKEATYEFLDKFFAEMCGLFPGPYMHIGADENNGLVWKRNPAIVAFMEKNGYKDVRALQTYFVKRVQAMIARYGKRVVGWQEMFMPGMPTDIVLQLWNPDEGGPDLAGRIAANGNRMLLSRGFYLDYFLPAHAHYLNPIMLQARAGRLYDGGEAAMWAELLDSGMSESRVWPRAGAVAERLWSPESVRDIDDFYRRLWRLSAQLDEAGVDHLGAYERKIRRLAGGNPADVAPVRTLVDVLTPVKGLTRLLGLLMLPPRRYSLTAPLERVVDAAQIDSRARFEFRTAVAAYLAARTKESEAAVRLRLLDWAGNHARLETIIAAGSAPLREVELHSRNLSAAARLGLAALEARRTANGTSSAPLAGAGAQRMLAELKSMRGSAGEVEIAVLDEIEALITGTLKPLPVEYKVD
jgi:hexosaminidase